MPDVLSFALRAGHGVAHAKLVDVHSAASSAHRCAARQLALSSTAKGIPPCLHAPDVRAVREVIRRAAAGASIRPFQSLNSAQGPRRAASPSVTASSATVRLLRHGPIVLPLGPGSLQRGCRTEPLCTPRARSGVKRVDAESVSLLGIRHAQSTGSRKAFYRSTFSRASHRQAPPGSARQERQGHAERTRPQAHCGRGSGGGDRVSACTCDEQTCQVHDVTPENRSAMADQLGFFRPTWEQLEARAITAERAAGFLLTARATWSGSSGTYRPIPLDGIAGARASGEYHASDPCTYEKEGRHDNGSEKEKTNGIKQSSALPKGFAPARTKLDGFFEREKGSCITGILRGSFTVKGKFGARKCSVSKLVEGETQVGEGELVGAGGVVGLDETGYTRVLGELEAGTGVFVRYEGKDGEGVEFCFWCLFLGGLILACVVSLLLYPILRRGASLKR